jgi:ABC-type sugar transport system substrate-binding protein
LRRTLATIAVAGSAVALAACGSSSNSQAPASGSSAGTNSSSHGLVIGSVINDLSNPFLASMAQSEQAQAAKYGITLHVVSGSAGGTISIGQQLAAVQQFISQHVNLILLTPSDPKAIVPAVKLANAANIPVIAVNTEVGPGAKVVTFVGDDDYQYGVKEAQLVAQALGGKGNVALLQGVLGDSPEVLRTQAIQKTLANYPGIHIVTTEVDNWTNSLNITDVQNLMAKYPGGSLNAVVAEGPEMYAGAQLARSRGNAATKFIAGDYSKQVQQAIQSGALYGTVDQDPPTEGKLAVDYAFDWLTGKRSQVKQPANYIPLPLVTKTNVASLSAAWAS